MAFKLYIGNKCFSSWSLRPWVAMKHLGIPFEEGFVRLRTPQTAENLAKVSPTGFVPVLHHDGKVIWETLAILEYLNDLFPEKKLWPADIDARALARCDRSIALVDGRIADEGRTAATTPAAPSAAAQPMLEGTT